MRLSFHGGTREVTGACYLLETGYGSPRGPVLDSDRRPGTTGPRIKSGATKTLRVLVDCGLFQGCDECADLNFQKFKFDPQKIDAVLVTHAHLDHIGRIPKLVREGFRGAIYSTAPTKDLAWILLEDALSLSRREEKKLYEEKDFEKTLALWKAVPYDAPFEIGGLRCRFANAGHILGSAFIEIETEGKRILFTGDLGNVPSVLVPPPVQIRGITHLVIESTYGSREHEGAEERVLKLERAIEDVAARGGTLMIPAFATERTQDILYLLNEMLLFKRIPEIPVFVDSPLAIRATKVFEQYPGYYQEEIQKLYLKHPNLFKFKKLRLTKTVEESKAINEVKPPKVVIAGSGMMHGGRILHHARRYLSDPKSILLFTGYQAAGSLGRRLIDGAKVIKIFGEDVPVEAEVRKINGFSAHADNPQLFSFVAENKDTLKRVFVVQGEEAQALHFMQEVKDRLGIRADAPMLYEISEI